MSDAQEMDLPQWFLDDLGKHIEEIKRSVELPTWAKEQALDPFMPDPELFMYEPILKDCPYCLQQHEFHSIEQCPSKPQKHYCQWGPEAELFQLKCGREAELFCEIGNCSPGTWYCQFHYKMEHVEFECPHLDEGPCFCPTHDYTSCPADRMNEFENQFDDEELG